MLPPYKRKILNGVYHMYLDGMFIETIASHYKLSMDAANDIIDYLNEIYN